MGTVVSQSESDQVQLRMISLAEIQTAHDILFSYSMCMASHLNWENFNSRVVLLNERFPIF